MRVIVKGDVAQTPLRLHVNGKHLAIPFNTETPIPPEFQDALKSSSIAFDVVGEGDSPAQPGAADAPEDGGHAAVDAAVELTPGARKPKPRSAKKAAKKPAPKAKRKKK